MSQNAKNNSKLMAIIFVALTSVICVAIVLSVWMLPYDSGILSPANSSGNLWFSGEICETTDYIFTVNGNKIDRQEKDGSKTDFLTIYEGDRPSCLNAFDGWLWFCDNNNVYRIAYYGSLIEQFKTPNGCTSISLNGSWVYFCDAKDGKVYKMRHNGKDISPVTSNEATHFSCDNRLIIYSDKDNNLRVANTDGTNDRVLVEKIDGQFVYTLDELFYLKDGKIMRIGSLAAGFDAGLVYTPEAAEFFNYTTDSKGRGVLYYYNDNTLYRKLLASERENSEEIQVLVKDAQNIEAVLCINQNIYYRQDGKYVYLVLSDVLDTATLTDAK